VLVSAAAVAPLPAAADAGDIIVIDGGLVAEGSSGQVDRVVFTAGLLGGNPSQVPVTFRFRTSVMHNSPQPGDAVQGTACSGQVDYIGQDRTVTIPANVAPQVEIGVSICGDTLDEAMETFAGLISEPVGAECTADSCGAIGGIDDDDAAPLSALSVANDSEVEGDFPFERQRALRFTVTLAPASSRTVTVNAATTLGSQSIGALAKGSASCFAGVDYVNQSLTLQFDPGQTSKVVSVPICAELVNEPNENLSLKLSTPTNATIADAQAVGIIVDDD
jgi:serralysin